MGNWRAMNDILKISFYRWDEIPRRANVRKLNCPCWTRLWLIFRLAMTLQVTLRHVLIFVCKVHWDGHSVCIGKPKAFKCVVCNGFQSATAVGLLLFLRQRKVLLHTDFYTHWAKLNLQMYSPVQWNFLEISLPSSSGFSEVLLCLLYLLSHH